MVGFRYSNSISRNLPQFVFQLCYSQDDQQQLQAPVLSAQQPQEKEGSLPNLPVQVLIRCSVAWLRPCAYPWPHLCNHEGANWSAPDHVTMRSGSNDHAMGRGRGGAKANMEAGQAQGKGWREDVTWLPLALSIVSSHLVSDSSLVGNNWTVCSFRKSPLPAKQQKALPRIIMNQEWSEVHV